MVTASTCATENVEAEIEWQQQRLGFQLPQHRDFRRGSVMEQPLSLAIQTLTRRTKIRDRRSEEVGMESVTEVIGSINAMAEEWLTPAEAAAYYKVKQGSLLNWVRQGRVLAYKMSGTKRHIWRFRREDLDAALLSNPVLGSTPLPVRCEEKEA
jgi:excisionase family DNA binding protein